MCWHIPSNDEIYKFLPNMEIYDVPVNPVETSLPNMCHANVDTYISMVGGHSQEGSYVLCHDKLPILQLISHSIWFDGSNLIDITPYEDNRTINKFVDVNTDINEFYHFYDNFEHENIYYYVYIVTHFDIPLKVGIGTQQIKALITHNTKHDHIMLAHNIKHKSVAIALTIDYAKQHNLQIIPF